MHSRAATAHLAPKRIAVCSDDFGMHLGIDAAIIELVQQKVLSAVSCLSLGRSMRASAPDLAHCPVDKGLHLNFTEVLGGDDPQKTYVQPLARLIVSSYLGLLDTQKIRIAIERQLDAFEASLGMVPDYVDGHQHVHQLPTIRRCLIEILQRRYPGHKLWVRSTAATTKAGAQKHIGRKPQVIAGLGGKQLRALARGAGYAYNRHLLGVYDFSASTQAYAALLQNWLNVAQEGDLLMCHPAKFAAAHDPIGAQRVREFAVLSDGRFEQWCQCAGLKVLRYSVMSEAA